MTAVTAQAQPKWLDTTAYPFKPHYMEVDGHNMHYIDEGEGEVLLFVHGTPTWSFDYRNLVKDLSANYRCIAIDHIGFGLSDKPAEYNYTSKQHGQNLTTFIEKLGLKDISIVVHDFGGPIGLSYAINNPENVKNIIAFNTWLWSAEGEEEYEKTKKFLKSPLLPFLYKTMNFSPKVLLPAMYADKKNLDKSVKKQHVKALGSSKERNGALGFARSLLNEQEYFESLWAQREAISGKPTLFIWGMKDKVFPEKYLQKFQSEFSNSQAVTLAECGHFPQEVEPEKVKESIKEFMKN